MQIVVWYSVGRTITIRACWYMAVLAGMGVYSGVIYTYVDHGSYVTD
jgi:hypothetical protein